MIQIALHRGLSGNIACSDVMQAEQDQTSHGWRDKSADVRRADCGWESWGFAASQEIACCRFLQNAKRFNMHRAVSGFDTASSSS
jgi:hypothetical protein